MTTATDAKQTKLILTGLMLGLLLSSLDQTIISTAMPSVIEQLGGFNLYSWVFSIYMLTSTTAVPIFGKLADLYGRRLVYLIGMGLFVAGSALCGISHNMTELIIFRGIQGIGAGALMPIAMTIIGDIFPPDKRGKMQGLFGAVFGLSSVIGPAVGGFIVEHVNWQWIFYVNLPFGIIAAIIIAISLKETKSTEKRSIDWGGALFLSGAIVTLLLALVLGGNEQEAGTHYAWNSSEIIGLFSASAILTAIFILIESKVKEPILPLSLFRNRTIAVSNISGFFLGAGMFGAITYIPLFAQGVIGTSPSVAGYILTPLMISLIISSIIGGRLVTKLKYRNIIVPGLFIMAIGFFLMSTMTIHTTNIQVILYMIITGFGMGALMPVFTIAVQSAVGPESRGVATSSNQFFRSIGGTIGVSVMGALMASRMTEGVSDVSKKFSDIPPEKLAVFANPQSLLNADIKSQMPPKLLVAVQDILVHSLHYVFITGLVLIIAGLVVGLLMGNNRLEKSDSDNRKSTGEALKPEFEGI